ncbi:MAG TPA: hypothetical protein VLG92_02065 [Candidatus Saccharimonadia bacterium]|nr:hypothetical protein [Candidatus Saccharimonadia bacterium]
MAKLGFEDNALQRLYAGFKWARNNFLQLFDAAQTANLLDWEPEGMGQHGVLYQFQCLATTTDTYCRRISGHADTRFGIILEENIAIEKQDISAAEVKALLAKQLPALELLLKPFDASKFEKEVRNIQSIANHEYLHQGQLVVIFRQAGIAIPERFRKAFDL